MPYIKKVDRAELDSHLRGPVSAGELNYVITKEMLRWLGPHADYATYAAGIGVLETLKLELYRKAVARYEDDKCAENGEVYGRRA